MRKLNLVLFLYLLLLLSLGFSWGLWGAESGEQPNAGNSGSALNRLIEISSQLSNLNEKLRIELQDSKQSSRELQIMLETSRKELEGLRQELEVLKQELGSLRNSSTELLVKAENSQTELAALQTALRKAESSLTSLEISFAAYREVSENRIQKLEKEKRLWKWGCIAAGVLAIGFGAAFLAGR